MKFENHRLTVSSLISHSNQSPQRCNDPEKNNQLTDSKDSNFCVSWLLDLIKHRISWEMGPDLNHQTEGGISVKGVQSHYIFQHVLD